MLIDIIIIIVLIISLIRGYNIGFVRQFFSTIGPTSSEMCLLIVLKF